MSVSERAQYQSPEWRTPKWNAAIINVTNLPGLKSHSVYTEMGLSPTFNH